MSTTPWETYRLETFADAVFAIAITLLVIEIHLPPHDEVLRIGGVGPALLQLWPSYVGYVISFIVIGIMWANHHNLMKLVDRVDHGFITLTLLLLLCVAFLPFPTAVMAEHLADPDPHERAVAVAFYCGCFTVTAVFYFLMWWHAARGRRLSASHVPSSNSDIKRSSSSGPARSEAGNVAASLSTSASPRAKNSGSSPS